MFSPVSSYMPIEPIFTKEGGKGPIGQAQREQIDRATARIKVQLDRENRKLKEAEDKRKLFSELQTQQGALKGTLTPLTDPNKGVLTKSKTVLGLADKSNLEAQATNAAAVGKHIFDIKTLASSSQHTGKSNISQPLSTTTDLSSLTVAMLPVGYTVTPLAGEEGSFFINGVKITFTGDESVQTVLDRIETETTNDPSSDTVTASYDPGTDKITLSSGSEIRYAPNGSTNLMTALGLVFNKTNTVTSRSPIGTTDHNSTLENARLNTSVSGTGSFSVNGVEFEYDAGSESLEILRTKINSSTDAGVNLVFDPIEDRFILRNIKKGALDVVAWDINGNFLAALGLDDRADVTIGDNTLFTINGGAQRQALGEVLTHADHGEQGLTVTAKALGVDTVTVSKDTEAIADALNKMIDEYNKAQDFLYENCNKNATLASQHRSLYLFMREAPQGMEEAQVSHFSQLGIEFTKGSSKKLEKLDAANKKLKLNIDKYPTETYTFLETALNKMKEWIDSNSKPEGTFPAAQERSNNEIRRIKLRIESLENQNAKARRDAHRDLMSIEASAHNQDAGTQMVQNNLVRKKDPQS